MAPERRVHAVVLAGHDLHHGEALAAELELVGRQAQTGLDEGRRGQGGHVEDAARAGHPFQGPTHRRVGELHHEAHVGTGLAHPQGDLQGGQLVGLGADHRQGPVEAGLGEPVAEMGAAVDVGHAPALDDPGQAEVGVVVDDDHRHAGQVQLLDGAQPRSPQPAHDDVPVAAPGARLAHHLRRRQPPAS